MYPNLYFLVRDWFGADLKGLRFANMFGLMVAIAFICAAVVIGAELKRKSKEGLLHFQEEKITVGKPASIGELIINFLLGFLFGYKVIGAFFSDPNGDMQQFMLSTQGNLLAGILLGLLFAGLKWREANKQKLARPEERSIRVWPHDRVGDIILLGAVFGFLGAKIFDNLENWDRFIKDPIGNLLSPSGLTFYGGLICAALAIWWYAKKHAIGFWHLNDAAAPSLMLAYAVGRMGCQISGDGDWGILNSAYVSDQNGRVFAATGNQFQQQLQANKDFFVRQFDSLENVKHAYFKGVSWLPDWFFAYTYPHNVNKEGIPIPNCNWGEYCNVLPLPVFPTPLYEIIACFILFGIIWSVRKKFTVPGTLFGFYLMVNGIERFLIEKIRVNTKYASLPLQPTQAEIISSLLILTGIALMVYLPYRAKQKDQVKIQK
ncbi:MAG TPA: prolipoprotein diacylglyceryl transferase family protein [Chitinophagaceae bacterium]|nr:prolipoprotein diacylglyceryl transferase family protein [Chitinophagaceae bacterium]